MVKLKATKKEIMEGYQCIEVGYCGLSGLLTFRGATAYTCGVYGWNADIYTFADIEGCGSYAIVTGYKPFGNIKVDYKIIKKYETKAEKLHQKYCCEKLRKKLDELIKQFIEEVKKEEA